MSSLEALLKKLQTQKNKIELIKIYKEVLNQTKLPKDADKALTEVQDEIKDLISQFMDKAISTLETVDEVSPKKIEVQPEPKSVEAPKGQVAKPQNTPLDIDLSSSYSFADKQAFALNNRHLAGKEAIIIEEGNEIQGTIVSLACPYVVIKAQNGLIKKEILENVTIL